MLQTTNQSLVSQEGTGVKGRDFPDFVMDMVITPQDIG